MRVADLLVKCLEQEGVEYIFGVPGEENIDLMDALLDSSIQFVVTRHETSAAFMAGHYGRLTGKPGVCLATLGPGATNLLTGVANANMDQCPIVAITGQAGLDRQHKVSHQYYDLVSVYEPVTKWNTQIKKADIVPEVVRKAFQVASDEKPGATHIDLPEDIAAMEIDASLLSIREHYLSIASQSAVKNAVSLIEKANYPIILAGMGITRDQASDCLRSFTNTHQIPVVQSFMGKGALSYENELSLLTAGLGGDDYITCGFKQADLIISIGFDMAEYPPKNWNPDGKTPILHIDSQEAETDSHYPVHGSLLGDISSNINLLQESLPKKERDNSWVLPVREKALAELESFKDDTSFPLKPQKIINDLRDILNKDDIVISDVGAHKMWMARMYHCYEPNTCLISNGLASMGVAVPGAIGVKLVHPDKHVVAVCGDGSFQMTSAEMETAIRLQLPIVILLWRDEGYGLIEWHQKKAFNRSSHIDFGNPDFVKLAIAYGFEAFRIEKGEELKPTLEKAIERNKPVLIDCPVDYDENMKLTKKLGDISC
ncbi:acetolactate synthase large subunit [Pontibacillus yanchengensis]|uniref:Acetolactate synthase large subunit n=2 Tax=Pontibacillus yanchengensis TaxID=462910 RepID=A0A6I5A4Y5_9BACI|nr:acetolactate synthase large subunit [Pontibacillus yanchengensis]MYL35384.1 acetolactate synthase large subunit [Pontibacillus yanchengensis]MYL52414.1 acetolactate synthase large subunit [Pontibacillus yanchengensis]